MFYISPLLTGYVMLAIPKCTKCIQTVDWGESMETY